MNQTQIKHAYSFEAHSIQSYVFDSGGALVDMIGASSLIESLLLEPLDNAIAAVGFNESECAFTRRAGAAFTLYSQDNEKLQQLRDLWPFVVKEMAPGLSFSHVLESGASESEIHASTQTRLREQRNFPEPLMPVAGPLIERAPRTGHPAVAQLTVPASGRVESVDLATLKKRGVRESAGQEVLKSKFLSEDTLEHFGFPSNMESGEPNAFPYDSDNRYVAIIHIDGNRMGEVFSHLAKSIKNDKQADGIDLLRNLSEAVSDVTIASAKEAVVQTFSDYTKQFSSASDRVELLPFRPLVLGGDDATIIIRADFAIDFVTCFLTQFEKQSAKFLTKLKSSHVPKQLTACAGIAFVKSNQPFSLAYSLADSLCAHAKRVARDNSTENGMPSMLAFHRITTSHISDYETALSLEMSALDDSVSGSALYHKTMGAYAVDSTIAGVPNCNDLVSMKAIFQQEAMSRGPLRHFLTLLHASMSEARKAYRRWHENMEKDPQLHSHLNDYTMLANELLSQSLKAGELPFVADAETGVNKTFIGDLYHLIAIEGEFHERSAST